MLLSTAFCPPVEYFAILAGYSSVCLEACESYSKQSWRNRCRILSANGPLDIMVPVVHSSGTGDGGKLITGVRVEYTTPWIAKMKKAVDSAYDSSPFFEFYRDGFYSVLDSRPERLWDLNLQIIKWLCARIGISPEIRFSDTYLRAGDFGHFVSAAPDPEGDYRETIHPKRQNTILKDMGLDRPYWQVFREKFGFVPGLSVLDLLFNEGPESICWLK